MHFWINKPAGRYYGFTGRRYPATPLRKMRSNFEYIDRCRYTVGLRPIVSPGHRFRNLNDTPNPNLAGLKLQCGVYITFVLATGFIAAAKFYFGSHGSDVLEFCCLSTLLLTVWLYVILRRHCHYNNHQEHHIQEEHIASLPTASTAPTESIRPVPIFKQNSPPPPYHIAILIPPPNSSDETPPPSYDKVIR